MGGQAPGVKGVSGIMAVGRDPVAVRPLVAGPYRGAVVAALDGPGLREALGVLPDLLAAGDTIHEGRNRVIRCRFDADGRRLDLAVKSFAPGSAGFGWPARGRQRKARKAWAAALHLAAHGGLTPAPVAWLERPGRRGALESAVIACHWEGACSFRDALARVFRESPETSVLMPLLERVAGAVRAMHASGFMHGDLGNQNILLAAPEAAAPSPGVGFIDLNRGRFAEPPGLRLRARDLSRIDLPSDLRRIFFEMVFQGPIPRRFRRWELHYRRRFAWHSATRRLRHPVRTLRAPRSAAAVRDPRDFWIWDACSDQPVNAWTSRDRNRLHPHGAYLAEGLRALPALPAVVRAYRRLKRAAYTRPIELAGRVGVAVRLRPETEARERALLEELGHVPVLVRFCRHEGAAVWAAVAAAVRRLHEAGYPVTVALAQDRRAVREPARWRAFLDAVLERVHDVVEAVEVGHAVNRVKWGIWSLADYRGLAEATAAAMARYPRLDWLGPACIDAEPHTTLGFLRALPAPLQFSALSQHLYVDRRGAPENRQGRFATLEKAVLARAIAEADPRGGGRLVVSEFNWPLAGTGIWSPVGSPYLYPGQVVGAPNVTEELQADYLLRYLLIVLCSGMVERAFWWRLAAHGYGLVDDRDPQGWRRRPGFHALRGFLHRLGRARFLGRPAVPAGVQAFDFEADGRRCRLAYAHPAPVAYRPPFPVDETVDLPERAVPPGTPLTGTPRLFVRRS